MPKFYIKSGTLQTVVSADDSRKAALWAVHRAMQQVIPMDDDDTASAEEKGQTIANEGVMILDQQIQISEVGFDRSDAQVIQTFDVVSEWNQLMIALSRLENLL